MQKLLHEDRLKMRQAALESLGENELFRSATNSDGVTLPLANTENLYYAGSVYIGTPQQGGSEFIFDSGSGYLTTTSVGCLTCNTTAPVYNPAASSTYSKDTTGTYASTISLSYGSADLKGYMGTDVVSLTPSGTSPQLTATDFSFFIITE